MAQTIVGLYDDHATAKKAVRELESFGFGTDHLNVSTHESTDSNYHVSPKKANTDWMTTHGIPEEEAHFYAEGVRRGGALVVVRAHDDNAEDAAEIMARFRPVQYENRHKAYQEEGFTTFDESAPAFTEEERTRERGRFAEQQSVKLAEEELKVGKREKAAGGIRLHKYVIETPVEETLRLRKERVRVERSDTTREATKADLDEAFEEQTIEMKERVEEAVVEKEARVTGEVTVGKEVEHEEKVISDTLRKTEVDIDETAAQSGGTWDTFKEQFRVHFKDTYSGTKDATYEHYEPAYRFGYDMANDNRFSDRSYTDAESDLRTHFRNRHADRDYDSFADAIRYGFERMRSAGRSGVSNTRGATMGRRHPA